MCKPHPGQRCAAHTRQRVVSIKQRLLKVNERLEIAEARVSAAASNGESVSARVLDRYESLRSKKRDLTEDLRIAVRHYDSTKTGQRELTERIKAADTPAERSTLNRRLRQGRMLAGWHEAAWARHKAALAAKAA